MKRYQIFISSTYLDLKEERAAIFEHILKLGHIPVGMEHFGAANDEQFNHIKRIIDVSDYYVLIIGNRYGSIAEDGVSYTEKEYNYAIKQEIPVLAFIHSEPNLFFSVDRSDTTEKSKKLLTSFRNNVSKKRLVNLLNWTTPDKLAKEVGVSLMQAFNIYERPGWERVSTFENSILLEQLNNLKIENENLSKELLAKTEETKCYLNNLVGAFSDVFSSTKYIKNLRIFGVTTATLQPKLIDFPDLFIEKCTILLRKFPDGSGLFSSSYEQTKEAAIVRWNELIINGRIKEITIIEYDKYPDIWYLIADEKHLLTDIFIMNDNDTPYDIQLNKAVKSITSSTQIGNEIVKRYINQFDNYVNYYRNINGVILEKQYSRGAT
ncbi:MAG: DUF4062 domain-containing protein [Lachnospiraceae bacterium]|nr:DUF4062 domain-containing protein [Lachnospiraceae bacterium]